MNFLIFPFDVSKNDSSSGSRSGWFIANAFEVKTAARDKVTVNIAGQLNMLEANKSFTRQAGKQKNLVAQGQTHIQSKKISDK